MLKILQYGSPILEQRSNEVQDIKDPKIQKLINDMLKVLDKESEHSAGLSAPQVGESVRIAICRRTDIEESRKSSSDSAQDDKKQEPIWEIMINPVIHTKSKEKSIHWEGCLSINEGDLFGRVERSRDIKFSYIDVEGNEQELEASGFFSHVVQHEIDHLDGILFLKYIHDPTELYTSEELE